MATFDRSSPSVVYASRSGVPVSSALDVAGPDASAAIQGVLDRFGGAPLHFVLDIPVSAKDVKLWSNTRFTCLLGCGIFLLPGGVCAIRNKHWVSGYNGGSPIYDGSTVVDRDITVEGLYVNGNRGNGGVSNANAGYDPAGSTVPGRFHDNGSATGTYIMGVKFYGVKRLYVRDLTIYDPPSYCTHMANVFGSAWSNIRVTDPVALAAYRAGNFQQAGLTVANSRNIDGWHINGPAADISLDGFDGATYDDLIGIGSADFNISDNYGVGFIFGPLVYGGYEAAYKGPISRIYMNNIRSVCSFNYVDLFGGDDPMDEIHMTNMTGFVSNVGVLIQPCVGASGNFGRISIDRISHSGPNPAIFVTNPCPAHLSVSRLTHVNAAGVGSIKHGGPSSGRLRVSLSDTANLLDNPPTNTRTDGTEDQ